MSTSRLRLALRRTSWLSLSLLFATFATAASGEGSTTLHVATFDSGFGGYLTAKSIELESQALLRDYDTHITIRHYGDTRNLPYGEKSPAQIATLGSAGVLKAFEEGADMVFIACNTASTQYTRIQAAVDAAYPGEHRPVMSIIDVSAEEAKRQLDAALAKQNAAKFVILATPATVRSMAYPRRLAALYGTTLNEGPAESHLQPRWYQSLGKTVNALTQKSTLALADGRSIEIYQLAPANWVEMIEHGADLATRRRAVRRDIGLLESVLPPASRVDVVGYFCTHYPVLDGSIRSEFVSHKLAGASTSYISQGKLMASLFDSMARSRLKGHERQVPAHAAELATLAAIARPNITISGHNGQVTRELARTMFPHDPEPLVTEEDLGQLTEEPSALH